MDWGALESKAKHNNGMDKRKLRAALTTLDEVKVQFTETKQFKEECISKSVSKKTY